MADYVGPRRSLQGQLVKLKAAAHQLQTWRAGEGPKAYERHLNLDMFLQQFLARFVVTKCACVSCCFVDIACEDSNPPTVLAHKSAQITTALYLASLNYKHLDLIVSR